MQSRTSRVGPRNSVQGKINVNMVTEYPYTNWQPELTPIFPSRPKNESKETALGPYGPDEYAVVQRRKEILKNPLTNPFKVSLPDWMYEHLLNDVEYDPTERRLTIKFEDPFGYPAFLVRFPDLAIQYSGETVLFSQNQVKTDGVFHVYSTTTKRGKVFELVLAYIGEDRKDGPFVGQVQVSLIKE